MCKFLKYKIFRIVKVSFPLSLCKSVTSYHFFQIGSLNILKPILKRFYKIAMQYFYGTIIIKILLISSIPIEAVKSKNKVICSAQPFYIRPPPHTSRAKYFSYKLVDNFIPEHESDL